MYIYIQTFLALYSPQGIQFHPGRHPGILSPATHPHHLPPIVLRPLALVRATRDNERDVRVRKYPRTAEESLGRWVLSAGRRVCLRCRVVGHCASRRAVVVFHGHVSIRRGSDGVFEC